MVWAWARTTYYCMHVQYMQLKFNLTFVCIEHACFLQPFACNSLNFPEGPDTSQNSVRDFEIPDFRVGFQISKKDFGFLGFCCEWAVKEVMKPQMKVNVNLRMNPKTKIVIEGFNDCFDLKNSQNCSQNWQTIYPRWLLIEFEISVWDFQTSRTLARTKPVQVYINSWKKYFTL